MGAGERSMADTEVEAVPAVFAKHRRRVAEEPGGARGTTVAPRYW